MNFKPVFHVIAWLLGVMALLMGFCGLVSFLHGEPAARAFGWSAAGTLAVAMPPAAENGARPRNQRATRA